MQSIYLQGGEELIIRLALKAFIGLFAIIFVLFLLVFLFVTFSPVIGRYPSRAMRLNYAERTPYYSNGRFRNMNEYSIMGDNRMEKSTTHVQPTGRIPVVKTDSIPPASESVPAITWLGHSSILLQKGGLNILIDPILNQSVSPVSFMFISRGRFSEIPITTENLPFIDVVLISHGHYDHLDFDSIKKIDEKVGQYLVPLGTESYLMGWGVEKSKITNMAWWEEVESNNVNFAFVPALHYCIRNPFKAGQTWWGGFVVNDGLYTSYYTGDSGYDEEIFREILNRYGAIDLLLPDTGQYSTNWPQSHMDPQQVFKAAGDLQSKWVMPVHWGAFVLSDHNWYDPPQLLIKQAEASTIKVITPLIGETVSYSEIENYQQKWWEDIE